jgi:hypothetical protein
MFTRARAGALVSIAAIAAASSLATGTAAAAEDPVATLPAVKHSLSSKQAKRRDCAPLAKSRARGVDTATYRAPMDGYATFRLASKRPSDWDLAVYDKRTKRYIGSSAAFGSSEVVQDWVESGQELLIQGCRRSGTGRTATASVVLADLERPKAAPKASLVRVEVPNRSRFEQLERLGVDVTHEAQDGHADVIVAGDAQRDLLKKTGFDFETRVDDLAEHYSKSRQADARFALAGGADLPSGNRSTYRTYEEIQQELKQLAEGFPGHVKPMTLPQRSYQGRPLDGIEIGANIRKTEEDGRPVFLLVAVHHAREWPAAEAAMEYAWMLAKGYGSDERITSLLRRTRVVVVPLINPDGYISSRSALDPVDEIYGLGFNPNFDDPTPDPSPTDCQVSPVVGGECSIRLSLATQAVGLQAYRRKNCRGAGDPTTPCTLQWGVDPNRNYGQLWGGNGSDGDRTSQTYRGTGPWSETETTAVHEYSQRRHITSLITLHNVAAMVLRPPGLQSEGFAPDEAELKKVGDRIAAAAGYQSLYGWQLYDTTGTTEDWNYAAQGTFGYTIEIGPRDGEFHEPYQQGFVDQWTGAYAGNDKGLREALLIGTETASDTTNHGVLDIKAPARRTLRLNKRFTTMTSAYCEEEVKAPALNYEHPIISQIPHCINPREPQAVPDKLDTTVSVPVNGKVLWHVNPSTRPFVGADRVIPGALQTTPYRTQEFKNEEETRSSELPQQEGDNRPTSVDREFTVTEAEKAKQLVITLNAELPTDDYDIYLYRREADGTLTEVATAGFPASVLEQIVVEGADVKPGNYVVRVNNFLSVRQGWTMTVERFTTSADQVIPGRKEAWTLECLSEGRVLERREVVVDRGETVALKLGCKR